MRSGSGKPQNRNQPAQFFEVAVGSDECRILRQSESSREAVSVGKLVTNLEFGGLQRRRKIHRHHLYGETLKVCEDAAGLRFSMTGPHQVEDFSKIDYRNHEPCAFAKGLAQQSVHCPSTGSKQKKI